MSGMLEKQGKLKRRLLCLPSLLCVQEDSREGLGGTGLHLSGSNSSSHAKLLSTPGCWQEASGEKRRKMWVWLIETLGIGGVQQPIAPSSLAHLCIEGKDKFKTEARMNSGQPRSG